MWAHIIVLRLSVDLQVENWRLTRRDLLPQYFPILSARSLKLKTFSITKHLSVVCLICSCFFDAAQTLLTSNQPTQPVIFFLLSFWKKFGGAAKKLPNLESHLNASLMNSADWLKGIYAVVDWLYIHIWKQLYVILIGCIIFSHMWK